MFYCRLVFAFFLTFFYGVIFCDNADFSVITNPQNFSIKNLRLVAAKNALKNDIPLIAQSLAEKILIDSPTSHEANLILLDSFLAQGKFDSAKKLISFFDGDTSAEIYLRRAIVALSENNTEQAEFFLSKSVVSSLSDTDKFWYYIALTTTKKLERNFVQAKENLNMAMQVAPSDAMRTIAKVHSLELDLSNAKSQEDIRKIADELSKTARIYMNTKIGFSVAKQYALALAALGEKEKAIEIISEQLQLPLLSEANRDDLILTQASLLPNTAEKRKTILVDLISKSASIDVIELAIYLYKDSHKDHIEFAKSLSEMLDKSAPVLKDRVLLEIAALYLSADNYAKAQSYIEKLLTEFPASKYTTNALRILAWIAFSESEDKSPDYRLAASYINKIISLTTDENKVHYLKGIVADCYFLNKDYEISALTYENLFNDSTYPANFHGDILNKLVESLIQISKIEKAVEILNSAYLRNISAADLWSAEWLLITYYRQSGQLEKALERTNYVLTHQVKDKNLQARMMWLKARLNEELNNFEKAISLCDEILENLNSASADDSDAHYLLASDTMLLKARALSKLDTAESSKKAFETFRSLRQLYPYTLAANASYLYEARSLAMQSALEEAALLCKEFADNNPASQYAPTALFEAAQYLREIALDSTFKDAIKILNTLYTNYPNDPKVFYARLSQAEILRLINAFAEAKNIYQDLINKFPNHPEVNLAQMGLGDTLLSQQGREIEASLVYERLSALPNIPINARAEAIYKLGFALERSGKHREAYETWWTLAGNILDSNEYLENPKAKYWLGRTLLSLARAVESNEDKASARAAYELIIKKNLPGKSEALIKLGKQ